MGIEPTPLDWRTSILPLNYIRIIGGDEGNRTLDRLIANQMRCRCATSPYTRD